MIGIDERGKWKDCAGLTEDKKLVSILTLAEKAKMSTGFVTTARLTHGTVAPLYSHSVSGDWESDKDKLDDAKDGATNCPDIGKTYYNCSVIFFNYLRISATILEEDTK